MNKKLKNIMIETLIVILMLGIVVRIAVAEWYGVKTFIEMQYRSNN